MFALERYFVNIVSFTLNKLRGKKQITPKISEKIWRNRNRKWKKNWEIQKKSSADFEKINKLRKPVTTIHQWGEQEEKGMTEDEMAGWHHWLDGHESEWTPGVGDGQGGLVCCDSWGRKESDTTERLIGSDLIWYSGLTFPSNGCT